MKIETQTITNRNRGPIIQIQSKHSINLGCPRCGEVVIVHTQIFNEEKTILQIQMKIETQTNTNTNRDTKRNCKTAESGPVVSTIAMVQYVAVIQ